MAQTAAGQEAWPWQWIRRTLVWLESRMPQLTVLLIPLFIVGAVGFGWYRWLVLGERASFLQDFFALCLDGIVFAGLVAYLDRRQALVRSVRLKSHAISLLLAGLPEDDQRRSREALWSSEALSARRRSHGVYTLRQDALARVLDAVCTSLAPKSGLDIQVLSSMLPVAAELSGRHLQEWGWIVESVKAYRAASPESSKSQEALAKSQAAIANLRRALDDFLKEEVFAP
jgi:hypothetical protein